MITLQIIRIVLVFALLSFSAALATPKGRLPLALRGVQRILRRDAGLPAPVTDHTPVSRGRRLLALILLLLALLVCIL